MTSTSGGALAMALLGLGLSSHQANAQADQGGDKIETVVVTAQLRREDLQQTPISLTALTADDVAAMHATSLATLSSTIPNVFLERQGVSAGSLTGSIRGIAFSDNRLTFEPTVGFVIDGVPLGVAEGANIDPFDVTSIEVARGPQGTLYGRNTIAGNVVVTHSAPTGELGGKFLFRVSSYDTFDEQAVINLPKFLDISTKLYFSRSIGNSFATEENTGPLDGRKRKAKDELLLGGAMLWEPSGYFNMQLNVDYSRLEEQPIWTNLTPENGFLICSTFTKINFAGTPYAENGCRSTGYDAEKKTHFAYNYDPFPNRDNIETIGFGIQTNWIVNDNLTLHSITGFRHFEEIDNGQLTGDLGIPIGVNGALVPLSDYSQGNRYNQYSQELRANWTPFPELTSVIGLMYFNSNFQGFPSLLYDGEGIGNQATRGVNGRTQYYGQNLNSIALYADATYDILTDLHFSAGIRYSVDDKSFRNNVLLGSQDPGKVPVHVFESHSWDSLTGRANLAYDITPDNMVYGGWAKGFRAGGFNGRALSTIQSETFFNPESADSYEIGTRNEFFDRSLQLNATIFATQYHNRQEQVFAPISPTSTIFTQIIYNAGQEHFEGFEFEGVWIPIDHLTLNATAGYTSFGISQFLVQDPTSPTPKLIDIRHTRAIAGAPHATWSIGGTYDYPLWGGDLIFNGTYSYRSKIVNDANKLDVGFSDAFAPPVRSADFNLTYNGVVEGVGGYGITLFARDAFDPNNARLASAQIVPGTFFYGQLYQTRTYGIELTGQL